MLIYYYRLILYTALAIFRYCISNKSNHNHLHNVSYFLCLTKRLLSTTLLHKSRIIGSSVLLKWDLVRQDVHSGQKSPFEPLWGFKAITWLSGSVLKFEICYGIWEKLWTRTLTRIRPLSTKYDQLDLGLHAKCSLECMLANDLKSR